MGGNLLFPSCRNDQSPFFNMIHIAPSPFPNSILHHDTRWPNPTPPIPDNFRIRSALTHLQLPRYAPMWSLREPQLAVCPPRGCPIAQAKKTASKGTPGRHGLERFPNPTPGLRNSFSNPGGEPLPLLSSRDRNAYSRSMTSKCTGQSSIQAVLAVQVVPGSVSGLQVVIYRIGTGICGRSSTASAGAVPHLRKER
jgi:hypothetical protein